MIFISRTAMIGDMPVIPLQQKFLPLTEAALLNGKRINWLFVRLTNYLTKKATLLIVLLNAAGMIGVTNWELAIILVLQESTRFRLLG